MASPQRKRSAVWLHFTAVNKKQAQCDICKKKMSYAGAGFENLKRHLLNSHQISVPSTSNRQQVRSPSATKANESERNGCFSSQAFCNSSAFGENSEFSSVKSTIGSAGHHDQENNVYRNDDFNLGAAYNCKQVQINYFLLKFIIKHFLPFAVVLDKNFMEFVRLMGSEYPLPSMALLKEILFPQAYEMCLKNIVNYIKQAEMISITVDIWTSVNNQNYMAINAHFITENWQLESVLLHCVPVSLLKHTVESAKEFMNNCFKKFSVETKIKAVVTSDSGIMTSSTFDHCRVYCFADILLVIVHNGIKQLEAIPRKVKAVVEYFQTNTLAMNKLMELQTGQNETANPKKLIDEDETIWNSSFYMIERFCELKDATDATVLLLELPVEFPSSTEMAILNELCIILKPFVKLSTELSTKYEISISKIIVAVRGLIYFLKNIRTSIVTSIGINYINFLIPKLDQLFLTIENNDIFQLSTFLDPRFKYKTFSELEQNKARDKLIEKLGILLQHTNGPHPLEQVNHERLANFVEADNPIWSYFDSHCPTQMPPPFVKALIELRQYSDEILILRSEDPLLWWRSRAHIYPILARLAKQYLCIPASSLPCEIISEKGLILEEKVKHLTADHFQKVIFLNENARFM